MVPTDATIELELCTLVVKIQTSHLGSSEALASAPTASTATTWESHIICIICIGHQKHLGRTIHDTTKDTARITILGTNGKVGIGHNALVHTLLDTEVEHGFFLAILDTRNTGQIALLIVSLNAVDNIGRQVLDSGLGIASHELLTIYKNLLNLFTINLDSTVVAHLGTWQTLNQLLDNRALGSTECSCIIYKGVGLECYLRCTSRNGGSLQHDGIGRK